MSIWLPTENVYLQIFGIAMPPQGVMKLSNHMVSIVTWQHLHFSFPIHSVTTAISSIYCTVALNVIIQLV